MSNVSEFEKRIYNCYLKNLRKGEPFQYRKDFSDLNPNLISYLKKISYFLTNYNHINVDEYFEAFNVLHRDEKYPPLNYFFTRSALKTYAIYKKQQENTNPENQFESIKNGMRFIGMFCLNNNIDVSDYLSHKTGYMYSWLNHYREHRINPYCLFELGNIFNILNSIPKDELYLFGEDIHQNLVAFRDRYDKSKKTKDFVKEASLKIRNFVEKQLTTTQKLIN